MELQRRQPNLAPQYYQMPQSTLKTVITAIILPSIINVPYTRLKGTEKLMDHLEEESLSQIKIKKQIKIHPDTPMQSGLPELALSSLIVNLAVSWTVMQTHVCWESMHTFLWTMERQLTLLGMTRARGHLQTT